MNGWTKDEIAAIGAAEELRIAGRKSDGSLRKDVIIWVVRIGNELFVRSVRGRASGWFRGVLPALLGHIKAGGVSADVAFEEVSDPNLQQQIDAEYKQKYTHVYAPGVKSINEPAAQAATLRILRK